MRSKLAVLVFACLAVSLGGCAYLEGAKNSSAGVQFCGWAPIAVTAIQQAADTAAKDPAKAKASAAMREAVGYLQLVASQCPQVPS